MVSLISTPDVPLLHGDEAEHRRLLALRANAIGQEIGVFTPTLSFATPGDLSHSYTTQNGEFWRLGRMVFISLTVADTLTFTTASGVFQVGGLPYEMDAGAADSMMLTAQVSDAGISYNSRTQVNARISPGDAFCDIVAQGTATAAHVLQAAEFTSGNATGDIRISGAYPIARPI